MKVVLGPAAVKTLIDNEPEVMMEIGKNAARQVADAVTRELAKKLIADRVATVIREEISDYSRSGRNWSPVLRPEVKKLIGDQLKQETKEFADELKSGALREVLRTEVELVLTGFEEIIAGKIDRILHTRLAALFAPPIQGTGGVPVFTGPFVGALSSSVNQRADQQPGTTVFQLKTEG